MSISAQLAGSGTPGAPFVAVFVVADLDNLPKDEFWSFLDNSNWCHA